jgi:hypothetical protein
MVTPEKDVAVGGDGAGEDGDGVGNFGVGGGGFNRSCCYVLIAQILGWRAILSRAKPGELSPVESEKSEPSPAVEPNWRSRVELHRKVEPRRRVEPRRTSRWGVRRSRSNRARRQRRRMSEQEPASPVGTLVQ